ncbi:hypothetical protein QN277_005789 [Acacia crassicarpa]|uniref:Uncharacterized protein n=1 Tax=Acacia crassicarpa TaxID=499986 RepID=A0AAE1JXQ3_9FABA|nr:hypothetical protein QN277_005789 [Acacia crassicarpa]
MVDDLQKKEVKILQEENKILEKTHRQKVLEVEKLSQTIQELEEVILSNGATANAIRDYERQISELQVGKSSPQLSSSYCLLQVDTAKILSKHTHERKIRLHSVF